MSPGPLSIRITNESPHVIVELSGYLNGSTYHLLAVQLQPRLSEDRAFTIDLERVTFIDSDGVQALLEADEKLKREGRRLVLRNVPTTVTHTLALFGLQDHFEVDGEAAPQGE